MSSSVNLGPIDQLPTVNKANDQEKAVISKGRKFLDITKTVLKVLGIAGLAVAGAAAVVLTAAGIVFLLNPAGFGVGNAIGGGIATAGAALGGLVIKGAALIGAHTLYTLGVGLAGVGVVAGIATVVGIIKKKMHGTEDESRSPSHSSSTTEEAGDDVSLSESDSSDATPQSAPESKGKVTPPPAPSEPKRAVTPPPAEEPKRAVTPPPAEEPKRAVTPPPAEDAKRAVTPPPAEDAKKEPTPPVAEPKTEPKAVESKKQEVPAPKVPPRKTSPKVVPVPSTPKTAAAPEVTAVIDTPSVVTTDAEVVSGK